MGISKQLSKQPALSTKYSNLHSIEHQIFEDIAVAMLWLKRVLVLWRHMLYSNLALQNLKAKLQVDCATQVVFVYGITGTVLWASLEALEFILRRQWLFRLYFSPNTQPFCICYCVVPQCYSTLVPYVCAWKVPNAHSAACWQVYSSAHWSSAAMANWTCDMQWCQTRFCSVPDCGVAIWLAQVFQSNHILPAIWDRWSVTCVTWSTPWRAVRSSSYNTNVTVELVQDVCKQACGCHEWLLAAHLQRCALALWAHPPGLTLIVPKASLDFLATKSSRKIIYCLMGCTTVSKPVLSYQACNETVQGT